MSTPAARRRKPDTARLDAAIADAAARESPVPVHDDEPEFDASDSGQVDTSTTRRKGGKVVVGEKRGRKAAPVSEVVPLEQQPVYGATDLARMLGYTRDAIYKWTSSGMPKADPVLGNGWQLPTVLQWNLARVQANARPGSSAEDELEFHEIRLKAARADTAEDARDASRRNLIEVELAQAVYEDDSTYVARHLRGIGVKAMNSLAVEDDPAKCCAIVDRAVEKALEHLNADHVDPRCPDCHPFLGGVEIAGRA